MSEMPPPGFGRSKPDPIKFQDRLSALCAMELSDAHGDPDRAGEMIERLINSLAFTIAIAAKGDPETSSNMLEGAISYLSQTVGGHAKIAGFMARAPRGVK